MAIVNTQLRNSILDVLTVPASKTYAITLIMICNNSWQASAKFDMHIVPSGDPVSDPVTRMINDLELAARETFTLDTEKIVLSAGDKISFFARPAVGDSTTLTDLAVTISYVEI